MGGGGDGVRRGATIVLSWPEREALSVDCARNIVMAALAEAKLSADSTGNAAVYTVIVWAKEIKCHILRHVE